MNGVNKAILIGTLGNDPEVRHLESGNQVANFSIATNERYKDKSGEYAESTEWHNIVLWGNLAQLAEKYLHKGDKVFIEGKLQTRKWEDKAGNTRWTTEVVARNLQMLGGGKQTTDDPKADYVPAQRDEDDLPF